MKRSTALGLTAVVVATSAATAGTAAMATAATRSPAAHSAPLQAAPPHPGTLTFGPCPDDIRKQNPQMQCAPLDVPLDYGNPRGEKLRMTVSKLPARKPDQRHGSLLMNPGGPGGQGIEFAGSMVKALPPEILDTYDLIGFDTRNTVHSTPISCENPADYWKDPLPDPNAPAARDFLWKRAEQYADGCQQHAGKFLPFLTSVNNARDMDQIRVALGEDKISYLGYSYGTYLGANFVQLFPQRVDRMILDSSVDPDRRDVWYRDNLGQDVPAQRRLGQFFDWAAKYDDVFHLGTKGDQVRAAYDATMNDLRGHAHGKLGPYELTDVTFTALYGEKSWVPLAQALGDFRTHNDDRKLVGMVTPQDQDSENENAIYNAVECADTAWPRDHAQWEADSRRLEGRAPMAAWFNSWGVAPCAGWKGPHQQPLRINGMGAPRILMFNSVYDVATPYAGALIMHRSLPSSVLVTERDAGKHGVFANTGLAKNEAANKIGTDYLVRGDLPEGDTSIPGHPLPDPRNPQSVAAAAQESSTSP